MTMSVTLFLIILFAVARASLAVPLFLTARKNKLNNLYWLSASFAVAVYAAFSTAVDSPLANDWVFHLGLIVGHIFLAMFIHTTFYRNRKSPIVYILALLFAALFVDIYALSIKDLNLVGIVSAAGLVNWTWHLLAARSAYLNIASDPSVENWVKARYKLVIVYVVMILFSSVQLIITSTKLSVLVPKSILPVFIVLAIGSIFLQFLVWTMPESFRRWLNRDQHTTDEHPTLSALNVFSAAMTDDTGLKSMACFYAIRTTISKRIGSEDSTTVRAYIDTMSYHEWESVLKNAELRRILINSGADQYSASKAIENAQHALVEKQSLITFGVR